MSSVTQRGNNSFRKRLLLPSLFLGVFLAYVFFVFVSVLLVNIAGTFNVPIGTASQLITIISIMGLIIGIVMSAFTIRFNHKSLFVSGIAIFVAGTVGWLVAPNFVAVVLSQLLVGIGVAIMGIMAYTLVGDLLPLERRGWAVGLLLSAVGAAFVIVATLSGVIAGIAGWRSVILWFTFPLSIVCLALGLVGIPSVKPQPQSTDGSLYAAALKKIFLRKSSAACAVVPALTAFIALVPAYAVTFYRIDYSVSSTVGGVFSSIAAAGGIAGAAVGGRLVNRFGRKPVAATFYSISGVTCALFSFMPFLGLSVAVWVVAATTVFIGDSGFVSLNLEQVPEFRGSMMSIYNSFTSVGLILGVIICGLVLNLSHNNFHFVMLIAGTVALVAVPLLLFVAKDPCELGQT